MPCRLGHDECAGRIGSLAALWRDRRGQQWASRRCREHRHDFARPAPEHCDVQHRPRVGGAVWRVLGWPALALAHRGVARELRELDTPHHAVWGGAARRPLRPPREAFQVGVAAPASQACWQAGLVAQTCPPNKVSCRLPCRRGARATARGQRDGRAGAGRSRRLRGLRLPGELADGGGRHDRDGFSVHGPLRLVRLLRRCHSGGAPPARVGGPLPGRGLGGRARDLPRPRPSVGRARGQQLAAQSGTHVGLAQVAEAAGVDRLDVLDGDRSVLRPRKLAPARRGARLLAGRGALVRADRVVVDARGGGHGRTGRELSQQSSPGVRWLLAAAVLGLRPLGRQCGRRRQEYA
mmetsp:Transcript_34899/g.110860  ORF Transcript_34899/g.110860 Transcript_34899/m.110860 type:complete len:351 (+) Transcript_34899:444-1496(+)